MFRFQAGRWARSFLATCTVFVAASAAEAQDVYVCALNEASQTWVGQSMVFIHSPGARDVLVSNEATMAFEGGPVQGRVTSETQRRIKLSWSITAKDRRGTPATMHYTATMRRPNLNVSVTANAMGFSESWSARGTCRPMAEAERKNIQRSIEALIKEAS
ncbi:MAG: hypothetical protein AAFX00_13855 [Pseudomonadota bacterium]